MGFLLAIGIANFPEIYIDSSDSADIDFPKIGIVEVVYNIYIKCIEYIVFAYYIYFQLPSFAYSVHFHLPDLLAKFLFAQNSLPNLYKLTIYIEIHFYSIG